MDPSPFPVPPTDWAPAPQRRPPLARMWLHALLFGLTVLTTTVAGTLFWQDSDREIHALSDFARHPSLLLLGCPYAICLLLVLGSHEMGHYIACRRYGIPATLPFFLPAPPPFFLGTFGAVIRIRGRIPNRKALFDVAAAGPLAGFAVALPILIAGVVLAKPAQAIAAGGGWEFGSPLVSLLVESWAHGGAEIRVNSLLGAGWVGMLVTSLNLFPVGQLDGGHAAYAISRRLHRILSHATALLLLGLVSYQLFSPTAVPVYLVWLVVATVMRDRHPRLLDESEGLGRGRTLLAWLLLLLFLVTFIPIPIRYL